MVVGVGVGVSPSFLLLGDTARGRRANRAHTTRRDTGGGRHTSSQAAGSTPTAITLMQLDTPAPFRVERVHAIRSLGVG